MSRKIFLFFVLLIPGLQANADVYRWVDPEGKVHYTDKKPAENAEDVTKQVNKQNIDTSTEELRKVETILRKENDADREYYQQQQTKDNPQRQHNCTYARKRLNEITGRVIFVDNDGKVVKVTEQERQKMVTEMNTIIKENCN